MIISKGNHKIGNMMNVSLTPVKSCSRAAAKLCGKNCYAKQCYRQYPYTRKAWDHNLGHARRNLPSFFNAISEALQKEQKTHALNFFRWHVGGDILNLEYFHGMVRVAMMYSDCRFLAFTKRYDIINTWVANGEQIPDNLTVIFSAWPGLAMDNPHKFPVAWMQDGTETRVTGEEIQCPGNCEGCGMCWDIRRTGKDVLFHRH